LSKINEKAAHQQIKNFLNVNQLLSERQHGYRHGKSTATAVQDLLTLEPPDFAAPLEPPAWVKMTHTPFLRFAFSQVFWLDRCFMRTERCMSVQAIF